MCGIAGIFNQQDGRASLDVAEQMGLVMTHRGPDNFGTARRDDIAMSHNRLSLLDLSDAANQPFRNDRYLLSYNGEIYNFKSLRKKLEETRGVEFKTTSDTEVLFHSLIEFGIDDTLAEINGMFAFAFYDAHEKRVFLARDRMGIKPLYYFQTAGSLYWASEVKALARSLGLTPDPIRTLHAATNTAEKSVVHTLFKGVFSVNPGCYVTLGTSGPLRTTTYYDVVDEFDQDQFRELNGLSSGQVVSEFDGLFSDSVERMLVSDAPIGAFVSGGIDSSMISAVAAGFNADIKLFTANIIGRYSEFGDVETLSRHLHKEVFDYRFEPEMMLRDWANVTYYYDCPIVIHVNAIPFSNVAQLARDTGVKAVLTGEGADELFLGYPPLLTRRYVAMATAPVRAIKSIYSVSPKLKEFLFPESDGKPISLVGKLVQGFELQEMEERAESALSFLGNKERREQMMTLTMIREHLVTLLHRNDRMGMMASIEARFPFLDEKLVKFAINLPARFKIARTFRFHNYKHPFLTDKWIVRKTAEKYLPDALVNKRKNGFPMYGHKFIRIGDGFFANGWIADSLGLDAGAQERLIRTQDPYFVAKLASVEIFGRLFSLGQTVEQVSGHVLEHASVVGVD